MDDMTKTSARCRSHAASSGLATILGNATARSWLCQISILLAVAWLGWFLVDNTIQNLTRRNMASGFDFLSRTAGFDIEQSPIAWAPSDSYGRALLVGVCNTALAAVVSI